jgi:hypothetical protein
MHAVFKGVARTTRRVAMAVADEVTGDHATTIHVRQTIPAAMATAVLLILNV